MQREVCGRIVFETNPRSINPCQESCPFLTCEATECYFHYPLKIILPTYAGAGCCKWVYVLNYGGGLVEGDVFKIEIIVKEKCCVLWTTQSFTKVYSCDYNGTCTQMLVGTVHPESLLCILPDPVVCFKSSQYKQHQEINLKHNSNLVLLDWLTSGRQARGEHWDFKRYESTITLKMNGNIILKEAVCMQDTPFLSKRDTMKSYTVIGLCILYGPCLAQIVLEMLRTLSSREEYGVTPRDKVVIGISPFYHTQSLKPEGCVIRFSAVSTYEAYLAIINILQPIFHILGGNPLENK